jgi:hypothetical protein
MTMAGNSSQPAEQAKKFIDASLKGRSKPPSKAAYARAVKLARQAIEELAHVARRAGSPTR